MYMIYKAESQIGVLIRMTHSGLVSDHRRYASMPSVPLYKLLLFVPSIQDQPTFLYGCPLACEHPNQDDC